MNEAVFPRDRGRLLQSSAPFFREWKDTHDFYLAFGFQLLAEGFRLYFRDRPESESRGTSAPMA